MAVDITTPHIKTLQRQHGIPVQIVRAGRICNLTAVPAMSEANLVGKDGSFTEIKVDDWLVLVSEWTLEGSPQKGDEIRVDTTTRYLVSHPDATKPHFQNFNQLDRPAKAWRIHSVPR